MQQIFVNSVNLIVHICKKKKYIYISVFTAERNNQLTSVVNFIPSKFWSFPKGISKLVLHTRLNVYRESSGGSWFVTNNLLLYYKWSETWPNSCTNSIFPLHFINVCAEYQLKTTCTVAGLRQRRDLNTSFIVLKICQK